MKLTGWLRKVFGFSVDDYIEELRRGATSSSGVAVTELTALRVAAFFAAVRVLSESLAMLPLEVYRRLPNGGKERDTRDRRYRLLHDQPNTWQTSFEWREQAAYHVIMRGNAYSYISRSKDGQVHELVPMHPDYVKVHQDSGYNVTYVFDPPNRPAVPLTQDQVLHIRGLSPGGVLGISLLTYGREVLGGAIAQQQHGNSLWRNGANPGVVLKHPSKMSDEAYERLKRSWEQMYSGTENAARTAIVEEGVNIERLAMTSEDAQFIESRRFSRSEISALTRVPLHMLGDNDTKYQNIEHQDLNFIKHALTPWLRRFEQALKRDLFRQPDLFAEFNLDALARGDIKSRYQSYAIARNWGWMSVNDIRSRENLNPIPEGDEYLRPLNMQPIKEESDREDQMV